MDIRTLPRAAQPELVFKLIIIGDAGCGKSAILHQFVEGKFKEGAPKHTIGVEFGSKILVLPGGKTLKLQIWDTSGQERFRSVTHSYYRGALGALVVYDISNRSTFESLREWLTDVRSLAGSSVSVILCGNKSDLSEDNRQVSLLEGSRFAQENDCMFLETSALNGSNVDEVFYKCARTIMNKIELGIIDAPSVGGRASTKLGTSTSPRSIGDGSDKTKDGRMCCWG